MNKNMRPISERLEAYLGVLVFLYQGLVLAAFIAIPFLAYNFYNTPFPGAFF